MTTHAVTIETRDDGKTAEVWVHGKLDASDYKAFAPVIEESIRRHRKIDVIFHMEDFEGWHAGALWEDVKFDFKHFSDIRRVAVIGDKRWERGMAAFCTPFTTAKVKFFEHGHEDEARAWATADD